MDWRSPEVFFDLSRKFIVPSTMDSGNPQVMKDSEGFFLLFIKLFGCAIGVEIFLGTEVSKPGWCSE